MKYFLRKTKQMEKKRWWASKIVSQSGCGYEAMVGKDCCGYLLGLFCSCSLFGISHLGGLCNSAGLVYALSGTSSLWSAGRLLWTEGMQACPNLCPPSVLASGHPLPLDYSCRDYRGFRKWNRVPLPFGSGECQSWKGPIKGHFV